MKILTHKLYDFVALSKNHAAHFAQYTYECGATEFVKLKLTPNWKTDISTRTYRFDEFYLEPKHFENYPYYVCAIENMSYVMYEYKVEENEIFIWVCYTEENHRRKGYITELLNYLYCQHPDVNIVIHTFNESLREISLNIGINLFNG